MTTPALEQVFGARMRKLRDARGTSQRKLTILLKAYDVELTQNAIWGIEHGERRIRLQEAAAIAAVLGTTVSRLYEPRIPWEDDEWFHDYQVMQAEQPDEPLSPEDAWLRTWTTKWRVDTRAAKR